MASAFDGKCFIACSYMECDVLSSEKFKVCSGCRCVRYCTKECQVKDWKDGHRDKCKIFAAEQIQTKGRLPKNKKKASERITGLITRKAFDAAQSISEEDRYTHLVVSTPSPDGEDIVGIVSGPVFQAVVKELDLYIRVHIEEKTIRPCGRLFVHITNSDDECQYSYVIFCGCEFGCGYSDSIRAMK